MENICSGNRDRTRYCVRWWSYFLRRISLSAAGLLLLSERFPDRLSRVRWWILRYVSIHRSSCPVWSMTDIRRWFFRFHQSLWSLSGWVHPCWLRVRSFQNLIRYIYIFCLTLIQLTTKKFGYRSQVTSFSIFYFLSKSAGISPRISVSHLRIGIVKSCVLIRVSASCTFVSNSFVSLVYSSVVFIFFDLIHASAVSESLKMHSYLFLLFFFSSFSIYLIAS